jgi:hypothetical protein
VEIVRGAFIFWKTKLPEARSVYRLESEVQQGLNRVSSASKVLKAEIIRLVGNEDPQNFIRIPSSLRILVRARETDTLASQPS